MFWCVTGVLLQNLAIAFDGKLIINILTQFSSSSVKVLA